jgi:hypothetical protein
MNFLFYGEFLNKPETFEVFYRKSGWSQYVIFNKQWVAQKISCNTDVDKDIFAENAMKYGKAKLEAALAKEAKLNGKDIFVRFGDLPAGGISYNHRDNEPELGVSCYRAVLNGDKVYIDCPDPGFIMFNSDRPLREITGVVVGTGSDGEPLLNGAQLKRKLFKNWEVA